jgi:hypothetical protein
MIFRNITFIVLLLLLVFACPAHADCSSPSGAESQTRFSAGKLYYCGSNAWREVPGGWTASGTGCVVGSVYVPHGHTHSFFSAATHANCASISQGRTCTNGVLSGGGTFSHPFCNPPCAGVWVGGYCWYKSGSNKHCNDACATHGGCNLVGIRDYAGSAGSNANCLNVLDALGGTGVGAVSAEPFLFGTGCAWDASDQRFRATSPATNCTGYAMNTYRACACNE